MPAAVAGAALLVLVVRNADVPDLPEYEVPEGFTPAPPPTTAEGGRVHPPLVANVRGTTTTAVPENTGRARLTGAVTGPDGPVAGATVRIERIVGDVTQTVDVPTGPDGRYDAGGIGGGRYRVRAFLPPTLAQATGEVLYLRHDEERGLDLRVESFAELAVSLAVAPEQLLVGDPVNIGVHVSERIVDADGVVTTRPAASASVQVVAFGGWAAPSPRVVLADSGGDARFSSTCRTTTPTQLQVTARLATAVPGSHATVRTFDVPTCIDPSTLTTTTTTTTDTGDGSSSSSTTTSTSEG